MNIYLHARADSQRHGVTLEYHRSYSILYEYSSMIDKGSTWVLVPVLRQSPPGEQGVLELRVD
jgi:hypothetical protein